MRHIVASAAAMLAIASPISSPAWAWTNTTNGAGPQQIVDGGPGAQATSAARASAGAVANQRMVVRVNPAPSGASTGAGSAGTAAGSAGSGGVVAGPGAGSAGSYNGATYIDNRAAPSIGLAPLYGGGARCPTVGLTGAGSATGGGGGAGVSWYSSDCSTIEMAEYMRSIGRGDVGQALLAHHYPELAQVLADMPAVAVAPVPVVRPAWCDKAQRNRRPTEASAAYIAKECG